ncbi:MAG: hypothetical protein QOF94_3100 [Acidobacteriaceae bacterium]
MCITAFWPHPTSASGQNPNLPRRNSNGRFPSTSRHPSGQICAGSAPSRCYRAGRSAAPTRLHPHSALPSLPPCRCVRVPCRRALSRRASPQPPRSRLPASRGCNEIKHDGFRVIARKNGQRVKLYSRPGNRTCGFPAYGSHLGCVTAKQTDYCPAIAPITMLSSAGHGSRAAAPDSWVATRLLRGIPADRRSLAR